MKKRRLLTLLPLIALLLSGCETGDIYIDMGNQDTDDNTQETSEPDTGESSLDESSPSENTTEGNSPSESTPSEPSSSESSPSENPSEGNTSGSTSGTTSDSHTPVITYSLVINNKDSLSAISNSEDNPNTNVYTLDITLYTYTDEIQTEARSASETDVTITSSNDNAIAVNGLTLILGSESDADVTLSATWNEHEVSDTVNINYTYTPHQEVITYRYALTITNKEALTATWKIDDSGTRTVAVSLAKYTIVDGIEQSDPEIDTSGNNVTLTQEGEGEVTIDGLDIAPSKVGSLTLSATYQNGEHTASDSVQLAIEDSIYEYNYGLTITNKDSIQTTEENPWVYQSGSKTVSITLSYYTYTASSGESEESTITGTTQNVSISVYDADGNAADNDITYSNTQGGISLSLSAVNSTYYTVVFTWTSHTEASDSLTFYVSEPLEGTTTYSISITNREALQESWYLGDESRTLEYSVKATTDSETTDVPLADYIDGISVSTSPEGYVNASLDNTSGAITLSLIDVPEDDTTVTVYLKWEQYGITEYVELNLGVHTYKIEITNSETLMKEWTIEDEATRTIEYACYIDDTLQELLGLGHVTVTSSDEDQVKVDGTTLTAIGEGSPTVTATWYSSDDEIEANILDTDSVILSINNTIKPASITLNQPDNTTLALNESITLTTTVLGRDGSSPATNPEVTWESNNPTGISVAVDSQDSTKATVTGLVYSAQATITATCGELSASIELTVEDYAFTGPKALVKYDSPLPTVVDTPDDRGVYVLGTENGGTYLAYDGSFKTTTSYDEAAAVRTIASNDGYLLSIDGKYLTESLDLTDSKENAKEFSISSSGVSSLYEDSGSLATSGTQLYILDIVRDESESYVYEGSYYLRSTHTSTEYFNGYHTGTSNIRLSTTTDIAQAVKVTIEYAEDYSGEVVDEESGETSTVYYDNAYYMSFGDGANKTYIGVNAGDVYVTLSSDPIPIFYNSSNDTWCDATATRYLGGNSASNEEIIGSYQYTSGGNTNASQPPVTLYDETPMEGIKGISLHLNEYSITEGYGITPTVSTYPSCAEKISISDISWSQDSIDGGSISIDGDTLTASNVGSVLLTGTYNSTFSDSITITIIAKSTEPSEELLGTYDFTNNETNDGSSAPDATTLTSFMNDSYKGTAQSDSPLSSVSYASRVYRGANGSSGGLTASTGCLRMGTSSYKGELTLDFGTTEITKIVLHACRFNNSSKSNYYLDINKDENDEESGYQISFADDTYGAVDISDVSEVPTHDLSFSPAVTEIAMVGNQTGTSSTTGYRILIFSIEVYAIV